MEVESHSEDENFECQKRRLFETAEWTLLRLNGTINEMKSWTREREILISDIYRLKIALGYSEKLLVDPLVMHQSQEIHRLERMNNDMRTKVESMSVALMNAERTVSWNVERKVRSEMAAVKCQVAEEKLHLAREIARLRSRLNEAEVDSTIYHEIRGKLDMYAEGDRQLDTIIAEAARKLIDTVSELSSQLIKVISGHKVRDNANGKVSKNISPPHKLLMNRIDLNAEEMSNEVTRLQLERQVLLKEMEEKNHKIFTEKELKVRALKRVASSLRTKLIISLGRNKKLCERLRDFEEPKNIPTINSSPHTDTSQDIKLAHSINIIEVKLRCSNQGLITSEHNSKDSYDVEGLNDKLIKVIHEKDKLLDQLEMERTTTREALKEFEKSVKETNLKSMEIQQMQMTLSLMKNNFKKLKIENKKLKQLNLINDTSKIIDKKSIKNRDFFFNKINMLKIKFNQQMTENEEKINLLQSEKFNLSRIIHDNTELIKTLKLHISENNKMQVSRQSSENLNTKIIELNNKIQMVKIHSKNQSEYEYKNSPNTHQDGLINVYEQEIELKEMQENVERLNRKLSGLKVENAELRAIESANTVDTCVSDVPQTRAKPSFEDLQVLYNVKHVSKDDQVTVSTALSNCVRDSSASQGEYTSVGSSFLIENASSEGIDSVAKCMWFIQADEQEKSCAESTGVAGGIGFNDVNGIFHIDNAQDLKNGGKEFERAEEKVLRGHWTIKNKFPSGSTPEIIMRNLEETDRQLSRVRSELSSVRGEIGSLRKELESRRFKNRLLERENVTLKEELAKVRSKILRSAEENRNLMKLGKLRGKL